MILAAGLLVAAAILAFGAPRYLDLLVGPRVSPRLALSAWTGSLLALLITLVAVPAALVTRPGRTVLNSAHVCVQRLRTTGALPWVESAEVVVAAAATGLLLRLAVVAAAAVRRAARDSAAHLRALELIAERRETADGVTVLTLPTDRPVCYSLAGPTPTIVAGRRCATDPVALAHEHAHLAGRHHRLMLLARVAARTLPWLPLCRQAPDAVAGLVEFAADRRAAREHGAGRVAAALAAADPRPQAGTAVALHAAPHTPAAVLVRRRWLAAAPHQSGRVRAADYPAAAAIALTPALLSVPAAGAAVTTLCILLAG